MIKMNIIDRNKWLKQRINELMAIKDIDELEAMDQALQEYEANSDELINNIPTIEFTGDAHQAMKLLAESARARTAKAKTRMDAIDNVVKRSEAHVVFYKSLKGTVENSVFKSCKEAIKEANMQIRDHELMLAEALEKKKTFETTAMYLEYLDSMKRLDSIENSLKLLK